MSEAATITTPLLGEEDYRMLLKTVKGRTDEHKGHIMLIQTKMLTHISGTEAHDMEIIAEIQPNTLETLKTREAKKGNLSPKTKHNEAITVLFKPGMEGNTYDTEGTIRRWAAYNNIKGIKWKGTNKEKLNTDKQIGTQEKKIARWILYGREEYPWEVRQGDKELKTHALHWNLSGLLYESITYGWKNMGADKESMQKFQEEYAERVINGMTRLVKVRARMVMDLEKKTSHVGRRHKLFVSTKKGVGIYVGNDMTMEDGKMVEIPTGEDAIDSMEGQRTKGKLCETTEMRWRMDQYKGVRMHKAKGKHTSGTHKVGDMPGSMDREEVTAGRA